MAGSRNAVGIRGGGAPNPPATGSGASPMLAALTALVAAEGGGGSGGGWEVVELAAAGGRYCSGLAVVVAAIRVVVTSGPAWATWLAAYTRPWCSGGGAGRDDSSPASITKQPMRHDVIQKGRAQRLKA